MRRSSIRRRITIAAVVTTMSIVVMIGALTYWAIYENYKARITQHMRFEGGVVSDRLRSLMEHVNHETRNIAGNIIFINALIDSEGRDMYILPFLQSYRLPEGIPFDITLCDFEGKPILSSTETMRVYKDQDMVDMLIGEEKPFAGIRSDGDRHTLVLAYPVFYGATGMAEGMVVMEVPMDYLLELAIRPSFAAVPTAESMTAGFEWNYTGHTMPVRIMNEGIGAPEDYVQLLDLPLGLSEPLGQLGMTLRIIENTVNTYRPFRRLLAVYIVSGLVVLIITYVASRRTAGRIALPLTRLAEYANRVSFDKVESLTTDTIEDDEVASLSDSFNTMLGRIRDAHDGLDRKVRERTGELERTNKELLFEIREREKAEKKIKESEEYIRKILDSVDERFLVIGRDFRVLSVNKAFCTSVNETSDRIVGRYCYEVTHNMSRPCFMNGEICPVKHVFETGNPSTSTHKHLSGDNETVYVETKAFPMTSREGEVTSAIEIINNITERYLLEEERLRSQKLEALGTLAGGIAHDFNNLLQGVFGYISTARTSMNDRDRMSSMLDEAEKALSMSVNLTNQLLTFSKGGKPVREPISLIPLLNDIVRFTLSGARVGYRMDIGDGLWNVNGDSGQLSQVVQNIVINAKEAMPGGGMVTVSAHNVTLDDMDNVPGLESGRYVEVSISDEGTGIPEELLSKIFDPYLTTKTKGSGLGLATSHSIIRQHDGLLTVRSEEGRGSTFTFYLPACAEKTVQEGMVADGASAEARDGAKILVMDDEEIVRTSTGMMLRELGYNVDLAGHGEEAIELYRRAISRNEAYALVILDLTVRGGMGGEQAVRRLMEIDPSVKAVVSSGYSDSAVVSDFISYGFIDYLTKPYNIMKLKQTIDRILSGE